MQMMELNNSELNLQNVGFTYPEDSDTDSLEQLKQHEIRLSQTKDALLGQQTRLKRALQNLKKMRKGKTQSSVVNLINYFFVAYIDIRNSITVWPRMILCQNPQKRKIYIHFFLDIYCLTLTYTNLYTLIYTSRSIILIEIRVNSISWSEIVYIYREKVYLLFLIRF